MNLNPKKILLKNGAACTLRSPGPSDAAQVIKHLQTTFGETGFMTRYPDEFHITAEQERVYLDSVLSSSSEIMVCAVMDGGIVGLGGISPIIPYERCRHRADFGISVLLSCSGLGIGSAILQEMIWCAPAMDYEQIELEVVCDNQRAVSLYEKFGFETYGMRRRSFRYRDGSFADEYLMMKQL